MRARVGVHPGGAVAGGAQPGKRVPARLAARGLSGEESPLEARDQILHSAALAFGGADHPANPTGLGLLTTALIALEGAAVGGQVGVELLTLSSQHLPEMLGLKTIRGLGGLVARIHTAR